jgi:hypothetical protein
MSGYVRRPFIADNGRAVSRWITLNQTIGNHLADKVGVEAGEIDSNRVRDAGLNATSHASSPAVEDEIYY